MRLHRDVEVVHQYLRNATAVILSGPGPASTTDLAALRDEYAEAHGEHRVPVYWSPEGGWQTLPVPPKKPHAKKEAD